MVAVRWYLRYGLSHRDVEELLAERGIEVDHVMVYRWVHRFTPLLADAARFTRHSPGDRWYVELLRPADPAAAADPAQPTHRGRGVPATRPAPGRTTTDRLARTGAG